MKPILFVACFFIVGVVGLGIYRTNATEPNNGLNQEIANSEPAEPGVEQRNCWSYRPGFMQPVAGSITGIESESKLVKLSIGSMHKIGVGDRLAICRDGNYHFGWLTVTSVEQNESWATVEHKVAVGDRVLKDTTLLISQTLLTMDRDFDPTWLAKLHVEADLAIDVQRILYYGEDFINDGKQMDEKSGLPLSMNGACHVSPSFVEFTKEYNRLMRQSVSKLADDGIERVGSE